MKTYFLPKELKPELRKIWGVPLFDGGAEILRKFNQLNRKRRFKKVITVGDYCSFRLPSDIKIFDGKIKKRKVGRLPEFSLHCNNPPGTIQKEVWPIIKKAIRNKKNVFVEGEEDLLVIPSVLLSEKNTAVVYGFPKKGACLIEVSPKIKKTFKKLLNKFSSKRDK
jgi:uncharacterized protein (UPF0218 family)